MIRRLARLAFRLAATALLGGLLTATLVRTSPGFGLDERVLDPRVGAGRQAAIRTELGAETSLPAFYLGFLGRMLRGDLGTSPAFQQPIATLILSRLPVTAGLLIAGVAGGWLLALSLAVPSILWRWRVFSRAADILSIAAQCVPVAVMAVLLFRWSGPVRLVAALALFGRLFEYIRNLLENASAQPHVTMAYAMGIGPERAFFRYVLPACVPELLALAGVSFTFAFGAAIPVETLCDLPGLGQLAWKSALSRDLPTLVVLAMAITLATQCCAEVVDSLTPRRAGAAA